MTQLIDLGKLRFHFAGQWQTGTVYELNDVVRYGGGVYIYTHPVRYAGVLPTMDSHWAPVGEGVNLRGEFVPGTQYRVGDAVVYGPRVYYAIADSFDVEPPSEDHWLLFTDGVKLEGAWSQTKAYEINDLVTYGGNVYVSLQNHTGHTPEETDYWNVYVPGMRARGQWDSTVAYEPNDLVEYGSNIYLARKGSEDQVPIEGEYWTLLTSGFRNRGAWVTATQYLHNDVVTHGGNTYLALKDHVSTDINAQISDGFWQKFNGGVRWRGVWQPSERYLVDDLVSTGAGIAICTHDHTSNGVVFDTDDGWDILIASNSVPLSSPETAGQFLISNGVAAQWTKFPRKLRSRLALYSSVFK